MPNPVCYFDIEIGGQPAGRIEMTVRLRSRARERDARPTRATFDRIAADRRRAEIIRLLPERR